LNSWTILFIQDAGIVRHNKLFLCMNKYTIFSSYTGALTQIPNNWKKRKLSIALEHVLSRTR